jgi:transposase
VATGSKKRIALGKLFWTFIDNLFKERAMTKKAIRSENYSENQGPLFMAFELGLKDWKLGFTIGPAQKARRRTIPGGDLQSLQKEIKIAKKRFHLSETSKVVSCYEAGRDGFWLHRYLVELGIKNSVVDSSSIEVNRKKRRAKADGLDVQKLLTMLVRYEYGEAKVWSVVQVPSPEDEDRRQLHRELSMLKKEKARTTNRIKGLLASQGIRLEGEVDLSGKRVDAIRLWDGSPLPPSLNSRLKREWEHVLFLKRQIHILEADRKRMLKEEESPDLDMVRQLAGLYGIGVNGSWTLVQELFAWREFDNRGQVGSLSGLAPTPYQSGESNHELGISKAGNRYVRGIAVELGWSWMRYQPDSKLTQWYFKRWAKAGKRARKIGIVALSRRLLIDLWRYLETGVVPEGARLKKAA